jgi:predicted MPP superfamily phosphohydrolase
VDILSYMKNPATRLATRTFAGTRQHAERLDQPVRIAHLTDQHVGRMTPLALQREAIARVNASGADVVALTGDFIAHGLGYLDQLQELLDGLEVPALAVLGNHDHWSGPDEVRRVLRASGVEVLDNASTVMHVRGQPIQFVGVDDAYTGHADTERATKNLRDDLPTVGLSHVGEEADRLWQRGVSLVLSGHTHSGQITVGNVHRLWLGRVGGHRYGHGLYGDRRQEAAPGAVYVSAGIGSSLFGLRLGERGRPEVALFDLGREPGGVEEPDQEQPTLRHRSLPPEKTDRRREQAQRKMERRLEQHLRRSTVRGR